MELTNYIGNVGMQLLRYETDDTRSVPVVGDSKGMVEVASGSKFSVSEGKLFLYDGHESVNIGVHLQYKVNCA